MFALLGREQYSVCAFSYMNAIKTYECFTAQHFIFNTILRWLSESHYIITCFSTKIICPFPFKSIVIFSLFPEKCPFIICKLLLRLDIYYQKTTKKVVHICWYTSRSLCIPWNKWYKRYVLDLCLYNRIYKLYISHIFTQGNRLQKNLSNLDITKNTTWLLHITNTIGD